jgi:phosphatidylglycerol---prolipoprotein diacylglyceryl transferase
MHPTLFRIGSFEVPAYGVMIIVGFLAGIWLAAKRAPRYGFEPSKIYDVGFWTLLAGIIGARIVFILQVPQFWERWRDFMTLRFDGLTSFGGLGFGIAALGIWAWRTKSSFIKLLDLLLPGFVLGHIIGRIGCLLNGCCHGRVCAVDATWCVAVPHSEALHFPAQAVDSAMNVPVLFALLWFERRRPGIGQVSALFFILHGATRFIYEIFRAGASSELIGGTPVTHAQVFSLFMMALGGFLFVYFGRRNAVREGVSAA